MVDQSNDSQLELAQVLAKSDLSQRLKYLVTGKSITAMCWNGKQWCKEYISISDPLREAVTVAGGEWLTQGWLDKASIRFLWSAQGITGIGRILQSYDSMQMHREEIDRPFLLNVENGVLDLRTQVLMPHDSKLLLTKICGVAYDPMATSARWDAIKEHLEDSLGIDGMLGAQRYLGSCLIGNPPNRKFLWFHGAGEDGKSTFAKVLKLTLGEYAKGLAAEALAAKNKGGAHVHELLSVIDGSRLLIASEMPDDLNWELIKNLSGGDDISTKRSHGAAYQTLCRGGLLFLNNAKPILPSKDQAAADRVACFAWKQPIDEDPKIMSHLHEDSEDRQQTLAACLSWLVDGCKAFLKHGSYGLQGAQAPGIEAPTGVEAWWDYVTSNGKYCSLGAWIPAKIIIEEIYDFHNRHAWPVPSRKAIGIELSKYCQKSKTRCPEYGFNNPVLCYGIGVLK